MGGSNLYQLGLQMSIYVFHIISRDTRHIHLICQFVYCNSVKWHVDVPDGDSLLLYSHQILVQDYVPALQG